MNSVHGYVYAPSVNGMVTRNDAGSAFQYVGIAWLSQISPNTFYTVQAILIVFGSRKHLSYIEMT